jgi:tagatose-1,6-bisphosphate aldolase non-catalytic subunit AgaZ/GatZ
MVGLLVALGATFYATFFRCAEPGAALDEAVVAERAAVAKKPAESRSGRTLDARRRAPASGGG